jgi:hypothetical protein
MKTKRKDPTYREQERQKQILYCEKKEITMEELDYIIHCKIKDYFD